MQLEKKIVAFDLDGTLAESKSPITEDMANLVKELAKQKIVVITSGGSFEQFKTQLLPPFDESFLSLHGERLILLPTSASQRYEYNKTKKEWTLTDKQNFPEGVKAKAKKLLKEIIDSGLYDIPRNPKGEIIEDRDTQLSFSALGQECPIEEKKTWDPDQQKRQKIKAVLEPNLPEVTIVIGGTTTLDILQKGFNKGVGLRLLLDKVGLQKSDMIYVGDGIFPGGNDYSVYESGIETVPVKEPEEVATLIQNWLS